MFKWRMPGPVAICADKISLANLQDMLVATNLNGACNFLSDEACDLSELQQWGCAKETAIYGYDNEFRPYFETPGFKVLDWNPISYLADMVMQKDAKDIIPEASVKLLISLMDKVDCVFVVSNTANTKEAIQRAALLDYFINRAAKSPSRKSELQVIRVNDASHILVYLLETDKGELAKRIKRVVDI